MLEADKCKNSSGVGGVALANAASVTTGAGSGAAASQTAKGAADNMRVKGGVVVGALAVGIAALML